MQRKVSIWTNKDTIGSKEVPLETKVLTFETKVVTFDDVLEDLGEFGRYQKWVYFLSCLPYVFTSMQLMGWVFIGANVPFKCQTSYEFVSPMLNETEIDGCYFSFPNGTLSSCQEGFIYNTSQIGDSVTIEFNLVCERKHLHPTIVAALMFGHLVGGIIFGHLADKIGRKPTFMISNVILLIGGLFGAVAPEYFSFVASRVIVGFAIAGVEVSCFVLGMELVGKSKRTWVGVVCWFFETSGYLLALAVALIFNSSWRLLQVIYTIPCVIFFTYYWIAPESARWLISQGKTSEAFKIIETTAKHNRVFLPDHLLSRLSIDVEQVSTDKYTVLDLFRLPNIRIKTCIFLFLWIICSSLYYLLLLDQSELSDNLYIGFLIASLIQLPGYVYVLLTLENPKFGRKRSLCAFLIMAGVCLFIHPLVYLLPLDSNTSSILQVIISSVGRFGANCSFTILYLYSAESFPTVVRSVGVGFTLVVSRIGTITGPYLLLAGNYSPMLLGVGAFVAGLLTLLLPETAGQKLPETLEDGEVIGITIPHFNSKKESK